MRCFATVPILLVLGINGCEAEGRGSTTPARAVSFEEAFVLEERFELQHLAEDPIGDPTAVVLWNDRIALLDVLQANIKLYDRQGRRTGTLGRAGDGPGEFRRPVAAIVTADGHLAALDAGNHRVVYYSEAGEYVGGWNTFASGENAFAPVMNGERLLIAASFNALTPRTADRPSGPVLHVFDKAGAHQRSFGEPVEMKHGAQLNLASPIAAVLGTHVVYGDRTSNQLHHFDLATGEETSFVIGSPYQTPEWTALSNEGGRDSLAAWMGKQTWLTRIVPVDSGTFAVVVTGEGAEPGTRRFQYLLMSTNGTPILVTSPTTSSLRFVANGRAYATVTDDTAGVSVEVRRFNAQLLGN